MQQETVKLEQLMENESAPSCRSVRTIEFVRESGIGKRDMSRILVVDDDEILCRTLSHVLRHAGHEVVTAFDGAVALSLYSRDPVDLVVIDLIMPGKEGLETIIELRRMRSDLRIIAISGGRWAAAGDYLTMAKRLGATRTLAKPFSSREILGSINETLGEDLLVAE